MVVFKAAAVCRHCASHQLLHIVTETSCAAHGSGQDLIGAYLDREMGNAVQFASQQ